MVLGGHGDSMIPLPRYTSVGGFPITELLDEKTVQSLIERTRKGGGEIVGYLKTGSAFFAPGASAAKMVEAVVRNDRRLIAASAYLRGEYGFRDIFLGVPAIIGKNGVERIIELELTADEKKGLESSAQSVEEGVKNLESIM
jgi:malate dehydrogenase